MVISSKGEYALRVMADLAINHDGRFIPLKEIVQKEELSQKYLESIMRMLSKANLIEAASGHGGGYRLKKAPEEYTKPQIHYAPQAHWNRSSPRKNFHRVKMFSCWH